MRRKLLLQLITALLVLLWVYAGLSKLLNIEESRYQMLNQPFPSWFALILVWVIPLTELTTAAMLFFGRTFQPGLYLSALLMFAFTIYIVLVLMHAYSYIPCSCGGVISHFGWKQHLLFNLFFLALTLIAIFMKLKAESKRLTVYHYQQSKKKA